MSNRNCSLQLADRWTAMWNGELDQVDEFLAPDFRIEFGAVIAEPDPTQITSPRAMAEFVAGWRNRHGALRSGCRASP
jgi:hypothetical protein